MWLDPITILSSPLAGVVYPAILRGMATSAGARFLAPVVYPVLALPLVIILGLNLVVRRFWCRYLCPLGALVALLSKFSWLKRDVADGCPECKQCVPQCPMDIAMPGCDGLEATRRIKREMPYVKICLLYTSPSPRDRS